VHIPPSPAIPNVSAHPPASLVFYQAQQAAQAAPAASGSTDTQATHGAIELDIAASVSADRDPQGSEYSKDSRQPPDGRSAEDTLDPDPDPDPDPETANQHLPSVSHSKEHGLDIVG
jgi:hypothetical protein